MNHKDDGTFGNGFLMALLIVLSAGLGYWVRDMGVTFKVQIPTEMRQK